MSETQHMNPLPALDRTLPFAMQVAPVVERIDAMLGSRAKACVLPLQTTTTFTRMVDGKATKSVLTGARSPLELVPANKDGSHTHTTFTRAEVIAIARDLVAIMHEFGPAAIRDAVPTYWVGENASVANLRKALALSYTVSKGANEGQIRNGAAHSVGNYRQAIKRLSKANTVTATLKAGDAFFADVDAVVAHMNKRVKKADTKQENRDLAEGTLLSNGEPRVFVKDKKAHKAVARVLFGADWWVDKAKKADRLTLSATFVYAQADSVGKTNQGRVTRAAAATLDDLAPAALRALAKKAGAPKRVHTGAGATLRSREWFSEDITRLEGVMTPQ
jgi:hypothetical protein